MIKQTRDKDQGPSFPGLAAGAGKGIEVVTAVTLVVVPLAFSPSLSDSLMAKGALLRILAGLLALLWLVQAVGVGQLQLLRTPAYLPFFAFTAISGLSLLFADNKIRGLETVFSQALMFITFLVVAHQYRTVQHASRLVWCVFSTCTLVALCGILQYNALDPLGLPKQYAGMALSTLGNTNLVAHYLEMVIPLGVALLLLGGRKSCWPMASVAITVALGSVHLVLTVSRGGWLSTACGIGLLLILAFRTWRWRRFTVAVIVTLALLSPVGEFALRSVPIVDSRTLYDVLGRHAERTWKRALTAFDEADFTRSMRVMIWTDTVSMIEANPFLGVGPGNFEYLLPGYRSVPGQRSWAKLMGKRTQVPYFAHNEYLEVWAETGIVGLISLVWLLAAMIVPGVRFYNRGGHESGEDDDGDEDDWNRRSLTAGCVAALSAAAVHAVFSFNLQDATSAIHLWVFAGLIVGLNAPRVDSSTAAHTHLLAHIPLRKRGHRALALAGGIAVAVVAAKIGLGTLIGDYYYFQALRHSKFQHYENAMGLLRRAIDWRDLSFKHHHELGRIALHIDRYPEAEVALRRSIDLHPNNPGAMRLLGRALSALERPAAAVPILERAVGIDPLTLHNYTLLADALRRSERYEEAIEVRRQAAALRPDQALLFMSLGIEYLNANMPEEAITALQGAARLQRGNGMISGNLGAAYLQLHRHDEAREKLEEAVRLEPKRPEWRQNLIIVLVALKREADALAAAKKLLALDSESDRWQEVVSTLERAVAAGGEDD